MNEKTIRFFTEDVTYTIRGKEILRRGILQLVQEKNFRQGPVNIILCSDRFLKRYNKDFLNHNYFTDVIAFDLSDDEKEISGDIYISLDRIRENAKRYRVTLQQEIARVIIHGVLHLTGMEDSSAALKKIMRIEENRFMSTLFSS